MKKIKSLFVAVTLFISLIGLGQDSISNNKYIKIRCRPSVTKNNEPLVVIDNKVYNSEILSKLNPENIKDINVLKGTQGSILYGDQGKSGVIIVTTKDPEESEFVKLKNQFEEENRDNSRKKIISVSGKITDCEGESFNRVTIKNLNSKEVFYSDSLGNYEIKVHKNDFVEFSKVDYISQKIKIIRQKVDIKLKVDINLKTIPIDPKTTNSRPTIIVRKPIIYLYPTNRTKITLKLDFKGKLLTTYPKYKDGWDLIGFPDGQIQDKKTKRYHNSLFWDGEQNFPKEHYNYSEGFEISKNYLTEFLIQKLELIGLNNNETNDFIQFWLPILEKNELNFIHFYVNEDYDVFSKNIVNPIPETSIRVFMEFHKINVKNYIPEQNFKKTIRKGFTLVEWGGSDVSIPLKEFAKSKNK